jgi:hypothetical protein
VLDLSSTGYWSSYLYLSPHCFPVIRECSLQLRVFHLQTQPSELVGDSNTGREALPHSGQMEELKEALAKAEQEKEAVRAKLHNAIRKGKAIEAERAKVAAESQALAERLQQAEAALAARNAAAAAAAAAPPPPPAADSATKVEELTVKLHNAVRKGKAIEQRNKELEQESQELQSKLALAERAAQGALTLTPVSPKRTQIGSRAHQGHRGTMRPSRLQSVGECCAASAFWASKAPGAARPLFEGMARAFCARRAEAGVAKAREAEELAAKLRNAVKKGKAIEAERNAKVSELEEMRARMADAESRLAAAAQSQAADVQGQSWKHPCPARAPVNLVWCQQKTPCLPSLHATVGDSTFAFSSCRSSSCKLCWAVPTCRHAAEATLCVVGSRPCKIGTKCPSLHEN